MPGDMTLKDIVFQDDICVTPPGVDPELWRLELPSILGISHMNAVGDDEPDMEIDYTSDEHSPWAAASDDTQVYTTEQIVEAVKNRDNSKIQLEDEVGLDIQDSVGSATPLSEYARTEIDADEFDDGSQMGVEPAGRIPVEGLEPAPHITLEVPYSSQAGDLLQQWNVPPDYACILAAPALSLVEPPYHTLELFAFRMLHRGSMNLESMQDFLRALIQFLPELTKARKRKCTESTVEQQGQSLSLTWGSYVQGGFGGVTKNTTLFPWVARLLTAWVRGQKPRHVFSSISLHLNTCMTPHLDKQNHPAIPNLLIACGRWQGGGLWVCEHALPKSSPDGDMMGRVYNVGVPSVLFRSHWLHSTMAWKGQRFVMVAYANKGIGVLSEQDKELLTNLGFHCRY